MSKRRKWVVSYLAELREARDLTQDQLAKELSVTTSWIYKLEAGDMPSIVLVKKMAKFFEKPIDEFLVGLLRDADLPTHLTGKDLGSVPRVAGGSSEILPLLATLLHALAGAPPIQAMRAVRIAIMVLRMPS